MVVQNIAPSRLMSGDAGLEISQLQSPGFRAKDAREVMHAWWRWHFLKALEPQLEGVCLIRTAQHQVILRHDRKMFKTKANFGCYKTVSVPAAVRLMI
jgi:hypothetical protein